MKGLKSENYENNAVRFCHNHAGYGNSVIRGQSYILRNYGSADSYNFINSYRDFNDGGIMISTIISYIIAGLFIALFWLPVILGWKKSIKKLISWRKS